MFSSKQDNTRSGFRSPTFILAAVFVGMLVVLGAVMTISRLTVDSESGPAKQTTDSPTALDGGCTGSALPSNFSAAMVTMATWELVGTVAAPSVVNAGPDQIDQDGFRSCFGNSEAGAIIAAANIVAMGSGRPDLGARLAAEAVAPGLGRDAALRAQEAATGDGDGTSIQVAGYRMASYDPALATVEIAIRVGNGSYAAGAITLRWVDDDWLLVVDPSTGRMGNPNALSNLGGYTLWGEGE
ncbi:hypothetical protein [Glaciibacter superstes]|uniref:hypothetical protein n=1 Tax=Glaciibacter superstes TaxID=501023 RepID=UPI00146DF82F|nr:hypothetical protein [Glaciibacter superstes]